MQHSCSPEVVDRFAIEDNEKFVVERLGKNIKLPSRYQFVNLIGSGGGGLVLQAKDISGGGDVAIKKILCPFKGPEMAKRCLREIHLLRTMNHPNIISLQDAFLSGTNPDLYFVMDMMPMDLRKRMSEQLPLPSNLTKSYAFQLLSALTYMHQKGIVHRDLKPENLLLDNEGNLCICDLGLARPADLHMTGYVSTRFYRAPEIMLSWKNYSESVDVWSAGCIISEMLTGHILFPGVDHVHHMNLILELLGTPSDAVLDKICGETTKKYLKMLPQSEGMDFRTTIYESQDISDLAVDLMRHMLVLDPTERLTAAEALNHPFFDDIRAEGHNHSEPQHRYSTLNFDSLTLPELKEAVMAEVSLYPQGNMPIAG